MRFAAEATGSQKALIPASSLLLRLGAMDQMRLGSAPNQEMRTQDNLCTDHQCQKEAEILQPPRGIKCTSAIPFGLVTKAKWKRKIRRTILATLDLHRCDPCRHQRDHTSPVLEHIQRKCPNVQILNLTDTLFDFAAHNHQRNAHTQDDVCTHDQSQIEVESLLSPSITFTDLFALVNRNWVKIVRGCRASGPRKRHRIHTDQLANLHFGSIVVLRLAILIGCEFGTNHNVL